MRKFFLLVCMVLLAGLATAQVMGNTNYSNGEGRWGLTPGGVVMSPAPPYPALMTTPSISLNGAMPRPVVPIIIMMSPAATPAASPAHATAPRYISLGAATFQTAYDLSGHRADLAKVSAELKQNRPMRASRTYTNSDIAALKPPKPLSH